MPTLFWLALLLGYLTGVAAAVLLLPAPLIEPLYGPLALATVVVLAAFGAAPPAAPGARARDARAPGRRARAIARRPARGRGGEPEPPAPAAEDGPRPAITIPTSAGR